MTMMTLVECVMVWAGLVCMIIRWMYINTKGRATKALDYVSSTEAYTTATGITKNTIYMCMAAAQAHMDNKNKA